MPVVIVMDCEVESWVAWLGGRRLAVLFALDKRERERGKYLWEGKGRRERKAAYVLCRIIAAGLLLVQRVPEVGLLKGEQFPAVEVYRDLDLGLVCVAVEGGGSGHGC